MTQKTIDVFVIEIYSKPPKKKDCTNKTDVYHIDDIWSLAILDLKEHGTGTNSGYRYVLVVMITFQNSDRKFVQKNPN